MTSPPLPRPVTPRAHVPRDTIGLVVVAALLAVVFLWWSRPPGAPATGTAMVVSSQNGVQVVSVLDGPEPGRHVVTWADEIPVGERFTVGLVGPCRCMPHPGVLVRPGRSVERWALLALGTVLGLVAIVVLARSVVGVRAGRAAQLRSTAVIGTGGGPLVLVLPFWSKVGQPLAAELWPVDADAPIGAVLLGVADRGFDPMQPFRAWGTLHPGDPIALTSEDGRQLVVPRSTLQPAPPPGPPGPVSRTAGAVLGWPNRIGPGGGADLAAVDAAVDQIRTRSRIVMGTLLAMLVPLAAVIVVSIPPAVGIALLLGTMLVATVVVAVTGDPRDPVRDLVAEVVGPGEPRLIRQATQAVLNVRHRRPPHGPVATADGPA